MSDRILEGLSKALEIQLVGEPLIDIGGIRWRPTFGAPDEGVVVYICQTEEIGRAITERMIGVRQNGLRVIALIPGEPVLLNQPTQEFLLENDVEVAIDIDGDCSCTPI